MKASLFLNVGKDIIGKEVTIVLHIFFPNFLFLSEEASAIKLLLCIYTLRLMYSTATLYEHVIVKIIVYCFFREAAVTHQNLS